MLEIIMQYSYFNGVNVYKIPIMIIVISQRNIYSYSDIGPIDKKLLINEVKNIV